MTLLILGTTSCLLPYFGVPPTGSVAHAVEGMFPMSELARLDLRSAGLQVDPIEIYNPDGLSLVDGICKVGGCTGSFVSDQGLILTNHHCAFRAIQAASSGGKDLLTHGFLASSLQGEVWAKGY
ncbi:MAG: S46 family peptidase, partial [Candidatus Latescibacterota bacterium]